LCGSIWVPKIPDLVICLLHKSMVPSCSYFSLPVRVGPTVSEARQAPLSLLELDAGLPHPR
jgi:hypothetical protein